MADGSAGINSEPLGAPWWEREDAVVNPVTHNYEAEQGLLGALLTNNAAYDRVSRFLKPEHFGDPAHATIYEAIATFRDTDRQANPITLRPYLEHDPGLRSCGGWAYLVRLMSSVVAIVNAEDYAQTIKETAIRRAGIAACQQIVADLTRIGMDRSAEQIIDDGEAHLHRAVTIGEERAGDLVPVAKALEASVKQTEAAVQAGGTSGLSSGLQDLDHYLGGMRPGHLIVAAGATSMGKTDFAVNIASNAALAGVPVAFFSLEMSAEELGGRILARETGIAASRQGRGQVSDDELKGLARKWIELKTLPLYIDDTPAPTVDAIRSRAMRMKRRRKLGLVVIDYLQLIAPGNSRNRRSGNRTEDVAEISRALKALAKTLDAPILALAQLSRALEARENKRPILADLRESGAIEQDADKVVFLFREEYYLERDQPVQREREGTIDFASRQADHKARMEKVRGRAEAIVAKNRGGPKGTPKLYYDPARSLFGNLNDYFPPSGQEELL